MKKVRLNKNEKKSAKLIYSLFQKNYYFQKYKNFLQTFTDKIRKHIQYLCNYNIISYTDLFSIFEKLNNNDVLLRSNENFSYLELIRVHQEIEQISQKVGVLSLKDLLFECTLDHLKHWDWYAKNFSIMSYYFMPLDREKTEEGTVIVCEPSSKKFLSLHVQLHVCSLIIPIEDRNLQICCSGFIPYTNSHELKYEFSCKYKELMREILTLPFTSFAQNYIEQLSPSVFCSNTSREICDIVTIQHDFLTEIKMKTISELVKLFLTSSTKRKREIIILLLLNVQDGDTDHLAFLLYDMISSKSFMLTSSKENTNILYDTLYWKIQQKLSHQVSISKNVLENSDINTDNTDAISYEKQILLMNTNDSVKSKAMVKLKEIKNGKGDSSTKAVQYLDGLLKIPFGLYRSEFIHELESFIYNLEQMSKKFLDDAESIPYRSASWTAQLHDAVSRFVNRSHTSHTVKELLLSANIIYRAEYLPYAEKLCRSLKRKALQKYARLNDLQFTNQRSKLSMARELREIYPDIIRKEDFNFEKASLLLERLKKISDDWEKYTTNKKEYMQYVDKTLDNAVYGLDDAKQQIKSVIAQWINGEEKGYVFGFEGPMGTGKTTLAKRGISNCLKDKHGRSRPFIFIALGGSTNGSTLEGHNYTYVGSTWGKIVDALMEAKCMNPIIYIDELDKISNTEHGRELIGILIHLTDPSQNEEFSDRYFSGIPIDLSRCLIIFSYNDANKVDRILLDRIHRIYTKALSKYEKVKIVQDFVMPELLKLVGFNEGDIQIGEEVIHHVIDKYTAEAGVRKLKEKLLKLIRQYNVEIITGSAVNLPHHVTIKEVDEIFDKEYKFVIKKINDTPRIGLINGLYASIHSRGGITLIQTFEKYAEKNFSLEITGQQGDVMKESIHVAFTIAWHILKDSFQQEFLEKNKNFGIHLHCPETATPKDGPSAGAAITTSIISLYTNTAITNTCAMTGEIDLHGNVMRIGGLSAKLEGARCAGVKTVLIPETNRTDYEKIKKYEKGFVEDESFKVICVKTIYDVFPHMFSTNLSEVMDKIKSKDEYFI